MDRMLTAVAHRAGCFAQADGRMARRLRPISYGAGPRWRSCRCSTRWLPQWGHDGEKPSAGVSLPSDKRFASSATSAISKHSASRTGASSDNSSRARCGACAVRSGRQNHKLPVPP